MFIFSVNLLDIESWVSGRTASEGNKSRAPVEGDNGLQRISGGRSPAENDVT